MPDISSNMGAGLNPLLPTNFTADVEVSRAPGSDNTWITGSLGSMNGTGKSGVYTNYASNPSLVDLQDLANIDNQGSSWSLDDSPLPQPDKGTQAFNTSLMSELLSELENGGMSLAQASQVRYYLLHPQEKPPATIKELMDKALSGATARYIRENNLSPDWKPNLNQEYDQKLYERDAGSAWDAAFEEVIKDKPDAALLRFEHYNRASGSPLTAEEKAALKMIQDDYGMPDTYIPEADKEGFTEQVNINYSTNFSTLLKNQSPPLSESDQAVLEYAFNHPDTEIPAALKAILAKLRGQAAASTSKEAGVPEGTAFNFQVNSRPYDAKLNGFFGEFQQAHYEAFIAQNAVAPWTEDNQILLKQYLEGTTTTVPDFIKAAAESIRQQAIGDVQAQFNLQGIAWSPVAPGTFPLINPIAQAALTQVDDFLKIAQSNVEGMPESPAKAAYLNILMRISKAITELKAAIYENMGGDTAKMREISRAKLDLALASIKEQMDGAKEVAGKQKKAGDLGKGVNIVSIITGLFSIIASVAGGPIAMALAIVNYIDMVDPKAGLLQKMMDGIGKVVGDILGDLGANEATKKAFEQIAKVAVVVVMINYGGGAITASSLGPKFLEMSGIVRDASIAAGASKEQADKANQYFALALTLAVAVGAAAGSLMSGGGSMVTGLSSSANKIMKALTITQQTIQLLGQAASTTLTVQSSLILADVAMIKGKLEAKKGLNDAEIQELMKLIKKLLAALNGGAEFLGDLTDTQKNIHANAIQSIAGLGSRG